MEYQKHGPAILDRIKKANNILVLTHEKPDGDALGSSLALTHYLEKIDKKHQHYLPDTPAEYFNFLPRLEKANLNKNEWQLIDFDLVIALDCGDINRTLLHEELIPLRDDPDNGFDIINIDHHASNNYFGNFNLVVPDASSTSEIIYTLFDLHRIEIDKNIATCLLTGIITDTMNFTNGSTTQSSLKIASELTRRGAQINEITTNIIQNKNISALKLWGKILSRLEIEPNYGIAYTVVLQEDLKESKMPAESVDGLINFLNIIERVNLVMVLTETEDGYIKGSLRTTNNNLDLSRLAGYFGGGGHKKASGFKVKGRLAQTATGWRIV